MRPASARSLAFQLSNDVGISRGHQEGGLVGCASSCVQVDRRQDRCHRPAMNAVLPS
jgi:hypothetical protein